jgi:hypothetical protein
MVHRLAESEKMCLRPNRKVIPPTVRAGREPRRHYSESFAGSPDGVFGGSIRGPEDFS